MPMLKIGQNHFNTDQIVNVVTPSTEGQKSNVVRVTLAGVIQDVILYDQEADAIREWLASQSAPPKAPAPAPIVTKSEAPSKTPPVAPK